MSDLTHVTEERVLGAIQQHRGELARLESRAQAMRIRDDLVTLRRIVLNVLSIGLPLGNAPDALAAFEGEARETIVRSFGTSARDAAETVEAALARMAPLPGSPYNDPGRILSDDEVAAAEAVVRAAIRWTDTGPASKVMPSFDLIMAELQRLRS